MLEESETSRLKFFLTDDGRATLVLRNDSFFIVPVVLCLPSMLQYNIRSKRIIFKEVLKCIDIFAFASLISFGNLKCKNSHKMECRILENSVQNLSFG